MISVLITRPSSAGQDLAQELEQLGYHAVLAPLFAIQPTYLDYPQHKTVQAVMITSGNALSVGLSKDITPLLSLPCFCVGTNTAQKARSYGFTKVYDAKGNSYDLTSLIQTILTPQATILHIAGSHISLHAHDSLITAGYNLLLWPVYQAISISTSHTDIIAALSQNTLAVTLVYSLRAAKALCQLITDDHLQACCTRLIAIGLSDTVLDPLKTLPWKQCVAALTPNEESMLTLLNEICPPL